MTFKEIINAEVGNRANYEATQAPKWEATVKAVEEKLQKDYAREQYSSQQTDRVKTFKNGQNAMGEFVVNVLIDLANSESDFWTGKYNYAILGMSKNDDTEFRRFYQKIEKLTLHMDDYEKIKIAQLEDPLRLKTAKGKSIYIE